jgi:hypothetical protein
MQLRVDHKCEAQHLQQATSRSGLGINDVLRAQATLKGIEGKRLTYRRLTTPKTISRGLKRFLR